MRKNASHPVENKITSTFGLKTRIKKKGKAKIAHRRYSETHKHTDMGRETTLELRISS